MKTTLNVKLIPYHPVWPNVQIKVDGKYHGKNVRFTHAFISITNFVDKEENNVLIFNFLIFIFLKKIWVLNIPSSSHDLLI
jgi:hypothetical protein